MPNDAMRVLSAIRAHYWAILPEYLDAIDAIALRAFEAGSLVQVAGDGHQERLQASLSAVAAVGSPLAGASMSTIRDGVAVVPVFGPIFPRATMLNSSAGGTSLDAILRDLRVAMADGDVERIVMVFDTPGGVVSGLGEAALAIRSATKPVSAFVTGMAASAGYWLASQAREIVVDPSAMVGNIGVVVSVARQVQPGADGRILHEIVSSNAPMKRPDPATEEGLAAWREMLDAAEAVFIGDVAAGRGVSEAKVRKDYGRGATIAAARAVEIGMADRIGTLESVLKTTRVSGASRGRAQQSRASAEVDMRRRAAQ